MAYLLLKLGMSTMAISRELEVCYKTAYYTARRILQQAEFFRSMFRAFPPIEVDKVYQNAGTKGFKKRSKRRELKAKGRGTYLTECVPVFTIVSRTSKTTIFVARFSADASEIKRRVLPFLGLRGSAIANALRSYSLAFFDYKHSVVNRKSSRLLRILHTNHCESRNLCFRIFMAPRRSVPKVYFDLYAIGATFYANFYSAGPCVALTALCFMLVGEVL